MFRHKSCGGIPNPGESGALFRAGIQTYPCAMNLPPSAPSYCVLVVEDDARTRQYFAHCVQSCDRLLLLGCLGSVAEFRSWMAASDKAPDALLTDLGLPDGSGIDVIREMLARYPSCEALVVSIFGDEEHVLASIEAGALGYVHKDSGAENVAQTILDLKAGASPISPGIARRLLMHYRDGSAALPATAAPLTSTSPLSGREAEILDLLARGFSYIEIASLCGLARNTVASHVKNMYRKMHVSSRSEAVFEGMQAGFIRAPAGR